MPRKVFTKSDMEKLLASSRKNNKSDLNGLGGQTARLARMVKLWTNSKANVPMDNNDELSVSPNGIVTVSNNAKIQTEIFIKDEREYYEAESFRKTFDTEVGQLKTAEPPEEPAPPLEPPPAPTDVRINCLNHHWTIDGKKGRTEQDKPSWHHNHHPLGNNPGGGYLVIPDDHPLFYLRNCEPRSARNTFNYEWKVDGTLVSKEASYHMFNASKTSEKWRDADDVVIEVRVWNESGEMKAKTRMRSARDVGHIDHLFPDGDPIPQYAWKGVRYFDEDEFFAGGWKSYTDYKMDPKFRTRTARITDIRFNHFHSSPRTTRSNYKVKPWGRKQNVGHLDLIPSYRKLGSSTSNSWLGNPLRKAAEAYKKKMTKALEKRIKPLTGSTTYDECDLFKSPHAFKGKIHINGKWVDLHDFWSGIPVKDPYDITNFMKKDKHGNYDKNGISQCDIHGKYLQVQVTPNESYKTIRFKWGFAYDAKKAKKEYWLYHGNWDFEASENDEDIIEHTFKCEPIKIDYYGPAEESQAKKDKEFTKSRSVISAITKQKKLIKRI